MGKKASKKAVKRRAAKKQRLKVIATEKRAAKLGAIDIRNAANIEECYGAYVERGVGDKVDIGREGEKRLGEFRNEMAWKLAKDGGQKTPTDLKLAEWEKAEKTLRTRCILISLLVEKLEPRASPTLGRFELLITESDGHVRESQNDKISGDSPQSDRILTRATLHQDTSQDQDEGYGLLLSQSMGNMEPKPRLRSFRKFHKLEAAEGTGARGDRTGSGSGKTCTQLTAKPNLLWEPGQKIRLAFLDGDINQHKDVMGCVKVWEKYANIRFMVVDQNKSHIRISFECRENSSYIGTDALSVSKKEPTVRLGIKPWNQSVQVRGTILHELGHVLGFVHEHSSPNSLLELDKEATCDHFLKTYLWNRTTTESEVLKMYRPEEVEASPYDNRSIMHYPFPASVTTDKVYVSENYDLSDIDKKTAARMYPFPTSTEKANDGLVSTKDLNQIQRISWEHKKIIFFEVLITQINSLRVLRAPRPSQATLSNCRRGGGFCRGSSSQLQLVLDVD